MRRNISVAIFAVAILAVASIASAQATRTWVSGVGDDANPCSRTAPCKTFAGAISKTAAGGEISTLDPGGFGAVTITKSITIDGSEQIAGVLASGVNGVVLSSAMSVNDTVVLRGLDIHGVGTGINGIQVLGGGKLYVENCRIQNFTTDGIRIAPAQSQVMKVVVRNSEIRNNTTRGIEIIPTAPATVQLTVEESLVDGNAATGIDVTGSNNSASVFNSSISHNGTGFQVQLSSSTGFLEGCLVAYNTVGINSGISGQTPEVRLTRNTISGNGTGLGGTGTTRGFQTNMIIGNGGNQTVTNSVASQ
jgi:hypothetical protein